MLVIAFFPSEKCPAQPKSYSQINVSGWRRRRYKLKIAEESRNED
jgi:hypothetical protein